jgi:hypothetical protein
MGGNKIKDLGNATTDGEAVNYEQAIKTTTSLLTIVDTNTTGTLRLARSGKIRCLEMNGIQNDYGTTYPPSVTIATLAATDRPAIRTVVTGSTDDNNTVYNTVETSGAIRVIGSSQYSTFNAGKRLWANLCWIVN